MEKTKTQEWIASPQLIANLIVAEHGSSDEQKTKLVDSILSMFSDPEKWPLTDQERIKFLQSIYNMARWIRHTEGAERNAKAP